MRSSIAIFAAIVLVPTAGMAEEKVAPKKDPSRIICEKQQVIGSRLATKKVCMTAAEWDMKRLEDRQTIEKTQVQRSSVSGN